jgi:glycosyltransferase involved in cell wall biosynthesis
MHSNNTGKNPAVSVIIPAFNTADTISGCLHSVFSQSYRDFEAIVVNDGSPDTPNLEEVLQPYLSRIIYVKQENKHAAGARNTAIRRAQGEFLAFLDSDDTWLPDHLAAQMALFEQDPTIDLVYANALMIGGRYQWEFMDSCPSEGPVTFPALVVERCQIPVSTVVARKSVLVKVGLFDESLQRCDDYDMWLRATFDGAKVSYTRRVQAHLNCERPGSLGQSGSKMKEAYCSILEKATRNLQLSAKDRMVLHERTAETLALYLFEEGKLQLQVGEFDKARQFWRDANCYLRRPRLSLALLGLKIAPRATKKLLMLRNRAMMAFRFRKSGNSLSGGRSSILKAIPGVSTQR